MDDLVQGAELQALIGFDILTAHGCDPVLPDFQAFTVVQDMQ